MSKRALDKEKIKAKLDIIQSQRCLLEDFAEMSLEDFTSDVPELALRYDATDDEDLAIRIDGKGFGFDAPSAFSGGQLHNLSKTVYFLTFLEGTSHKIEYTADFPPGTAVVERAEAACNLFSPKERQRRCEN